MKVKKKGINAGAKRRLTMLCVFLILLVGLVIKSVFNDWAQIFENKRIKNELSLKYDGLLEDEVKLESEVLKLQDPEYVARYAREKFGYTKDGELIIRVEKFDKTKSE